MWLKADVSKRFCDGGANFFDGMKEQCQVSCAKILLRWLVRKISLTVKSSENGVKSRCFQKYL